MCTGIPGGYESVYESVIEKPIIVYEEDVTPLPYEDGEEEEVIAELIIQELNRRHERCPFENEVMPPIPSSSGLPEA